MSGYQMFYPTVPAATNCRYLRQIMFSAMDPTRCFSTICKCAFSPIIVHYKSLFWDDNLIKRVITPFIIGRGPSCTLVDRSMSRLWLFRAVQQQHCPEGCRFSAGRLRWKISHWTTVDSPHQQGIRVLLTSWAGCKISLGFYAQLKRPAFKDTSGHSDLDRGHPE